MTRFFFHIVNSGGRTVDEEGAELATLEEARAWAVKSIRSILSDEAKEGCLDLRGRIEVADESEEVRLVVPFSEAVDIRTGPPPALGKAAPV